MSAIQIEEAGRRYSTQSEFEDEADEDDVYKVFVQLRKRRKTLTQANNKSVKKKKKSKCENADDTFDIDDFKNMQVEDEAPELENQAQIFQYVQKQKRILKEVKYQPWKMKTKKNVIQAAKTYVSQYEGRLSRRQGYLEQGQRYWRKFRRDWDNFVILFLPWEVRIRTIESHFGSSVASYFVFLRWLLAVNVLYGLLWLLVVLPEIFVGESGTSRKTVPESERGNAMDFDTVLDFNGYLKYSVLFYGYYGNSKSIGNGYQLPLAYLLVGIATYAVTFIIILRKMAKNARMSKMTSPQDQFTFSWKLFTGWDFMIGNAETADKTVIANATSFREVIIEQQEKEKDDDRKLLTIFLRILANVLVVGILCGSGFAIYKVVLRSEEFEKVADKSTLSWWETNEVSIVVTLITLICPSVFEIIGAMEGYHPRVTLQWQLARIMVLYMGNLYTLIIALLGRVSDLTENSGAEFEGSEGNIEALKRSLNHTGDAVMGNASFAAPLFGNNTYGNMTTRGRDGCWETFVGQEFFKLVFFDLVAVVLGTLGGDFLRAVLVRYMNYCWCWDLEKQFPEYPEFKTPENVLHLIYNQGMVWMGCFFSPLLAAFNVLKLVITLYTRAWAVMTCNTPHDRIFRASRSNNFFLTLLLVMLFLCVLAFGYSVVALPPSESCGPFSDQDSILDVIGHSMDESFPSWLSSIVDYMNTAGVVVPLLLFLMMIIYYLLALSGSYKDANNDLRIQLQHERTANRRKHYLMLTTETTVKKPKPKRRPKNGIAVLPSIPVDHKLRKVSDMDQSGQTERSRTVDIKNSLQNGIASAQSPGIRYVPLPTGQQITVVRRSAPFERQPVRINLAADEDVVIPEGMRARYYYRGQPVSQDVWMHLKARAMDKHNRRRAHISVIPAAASPGVAPESPVMRRYTSSHARKTKEEQTEENTDAMAGSKTIPLVILHQPTLASESDTPSETDDEEHLSSTDGNLPNIENVTDTGIDDAANVSVRDRIRQWVQDSQEKGVTSDHEGARDKPNEDELRSGGATPKKNDRREPEGQESAKEKLQKLNNGSDLKENRMRVGQKEHPHISKTGVKRWEKRSENLRDATRVSAMAQGIGESSSVASHIDVHAQNAVLENEVGVGEENDTESAHESYAVESVQESDDVFEENVSDPSERNQPRPVKTSESLRNDLAMADILERDRYLAQQRQKKRLGQGAQNDSINPPETWEVNKVKRLSQEIEMELDEFPHDFEGADTTALIQEDSHDGTSFVNPLYANRLHENVKEGKSAFSDSYISGEVRVGFAERDNLLKSIRGLRKRDEDDVSDDNSDHSFDAIKTTFEAMKKTKGGSSGH
ncbi:transmembrane channel-like protein 1 isoform X2 [Ptychodera flava]